MCPFKIIIFDRFDCPRGKHRTGHARCNAVGVLCGIIMLCASINEKDLQTIAVEGLKKTPRLRCDWAQKRPMHVAQLSLAQNIYFIFVVLLHLRQTEILTKEIEIIHRLFLVIAMYCQASSSQFNESLNLPRCQLAGKESRYMQQVAIHQKQPIYCLNFLNSDLHNFNY